MTLPTFAAERRRCAAAAVNRYLIGRVLTTHPKAAVAAVG